MSCGSKGIPGVWKARTGKKKIKTVMTELYKFKEFAICSVYSAYIEVSHRRAAAASVLLCDPGTRIDIDIVRFSFFLLVLIIHVATSCNEIKVYSSFLCKVVHARPTLSNANNNRFTSRILSLQFQ